MHERVELTHLTNHTMCYSKVQQQWTNVFIMTH